MILDRRFQPVALMAGALLFTALYADVSESASECLLCHGDTGFRTTYLQMESRARRSVYVDPAVFERSVHGVLDCSDCHSEFAGGEHPERSFPNLSTYRLQLSKSCADCHELDGVHARLIENEPGIPCVECHSAHAVRPASELDECLSCHQQSIHAALPEGTQVSLRIDAEEVAGSVHARLRCVDCHFGYSRRQHPVRDFQDRRQMTVALSESCRRCHFDKYTWTLESVHHRQLVDHNMNAPVCADCHGSHGIQSGHREKLGAAQRCQKCHSEVYAVYSASVHGQALLEAHNRDVPICSDCHSAHQIGDPRRAEFRNEIPRLCGDCHANQELMAKYGLSTAVLQSYLDDFHGVTLTYYKKEAGEPRQIAVCTDCHGVHDITSFRERQAESVKATLLHRCKACHTEASEKFPDSWISHYEPTWARAPLVYLVNVFYQFFIPFMVVGLVLQVFLHIWRYALNR